MARKDVLIPGGSSLPHVSQNAALAGWKGLRGQEMPAGLTWIQKRSVAFPPARRLVIMGVRLALGRRQAFGPDHVAGSKIFYSLATRWSYERRALGDEAYDGVVGAWLVRHCWFSQVQVVHHFLFAITLGSGQISGIDPALALDEERVVIGRADELAVDAPARCACESGT